MKMNTTAVGDGLSLDTDVSAKNRQYFSTRNTYLEYAIEPFDSTRLRGTPSSYDLGSGSVLPDFDVARSAELCSKTTISLWKYTDS